MIKRVCPDIILANNRIPKLKGFEKNEIISINIKKCNKYIGAPFGIKISKKPNLCIQKPKIKIPKKKEKLKVKAITI